MDGVVTVFDLDSMSMIQQLAVTKGCNSFSINEQTSLLVAAGKRKVENFLILFTVNIYKGKALISLTVSPHDTNDLVLE